MSIPVDLNDLVRALGDYGPGYLLSTTEGQVKVVTVEPEADGGVLRIVGPGGGSCRNVAANPIVTLVFPPARPRGYSLIVDGSAAVADDDVLVTATAAVLHRPAAHADGEPVGDGCGHDCRPVGRGEARSTAN
ncbi:MAG: pyridoxamine 5'-phosphate oxidase [Acidimicrobiales bacterium]